MTQEVSKQTAYAALIESGQKFAKQSAYAALIESGQKFAKQSAYVPLLVDVPTSSARRRMAGFVN